MTARDGVSDGAAHLFVADVGSPDLDDDDRHHVMTVLRLRSGEPLTVSDGDGRWRACRFRPRGEIEPTGEIVVVEAPQPPLSVGIALTKGSRPELAVQKLTELGIERIIPFVGARSVVRWQGPRAETHLRRLRKVAREASMQSGRVRLPVVEDLTAFADVAGRPGVALTQMGGETPTLAHPSLLVGPEGGWADEELALGLPQVGLGSLVLRAETAAIAIASLVVGLRLGLVRPARSGYSTA
ncbi:MAG TPA: RsmE family RNA methyltransferase [Acidimicrobiales bacterium]|nr:RsmE family RNA methyltransferase [Acidimicrobiales bacterium]